MARSLGSREQGSQLADGHIRGQAQFLDLGVEPDTLCRPREDSRGTVG
jgi:hypothetical protein